MAKTGKIMPLRRKKAALWPEPSLISQSSPDPRLVELVRLLARQAADDYVEAAVRGEAEAN